MIEENKWENIYVADLEANGLLEEKDGIPAANRIWCLSYCNSKDGEVFTITTEEEIRAFFLQKNTSIVMHNGILFDGILVEKLLNFRITTPIIDSLALSWTLSPERNSHGLELYGEEFGIPKPKIIDWNNKDLIEEYKNRCQEDVKINLKLWNNQKWYLQQLYENAEDAKKYIDYIMFKIDCIKEQQSTGVKLDIPLIEKSLLELETLKEEKVKILQEGMPKKAIKAVKFYPKKFYNQAGEVSAIGLKWLEFLKEQGLPETHTNEVEFIHSYEEPNPNSHDQIKEWLYTLGWIPENIKHFRDKKKNEIRQIPQIKSKDEEGEICESIKKLFHLAPALEALDDLFVISHRISVFKGFLKNQKEGKIYQGTSSLTNTLRLQHTNIVNLPNSKKPYSENIRKSLICQDNNHVLVGCDLSGIEDSTKRHYIYPYDPEYVETMNNPEFDPHIDIAVLAGFITQEQGEQHKLYDKTKGKEGVSYKEMRSKAKTANFALTYKCGVSTLARQTGLSEKEAKRLKNIYWARNQAILDVENSLQIKTIKGQMWLLNPISNFWYSLRAEKDKFSTLNQGSAVFVFDLWVQKIRKQKIEIAFQIHDEWTSNIWKTDKEEIKEIVEQSIKDLNNELKLNVQIGCSIDFGLNYMECH